MYRTIRENAEFEFTEKKSRFIGRAFYTPTEQAAKEALEAVRRGDPEARHHVFAYRIHAGDLSRMSDDGEPGGTGGAPVFNALKMNDLQDVTVTVTRYFGGILLGRGGLTRAYGRAAAGALSAAGMAQVIPIAEFTVRCGYEKLGIVQAAVEKTDAEVVDRAFTDGVVLTVHATDETFAELTAAFSEDPGVQFAFCGRHDARR